MRILFLTAIVLVAFAETITAASPSGVDINQQLVLKLESLEQKLASVQEILMKSEKSHEDKFQSLQEQRQVQDKEVQDLRLLVEILQAKLQSNSEESSSLKVQLINFFSTFSLEKKSQRKQKPAENNTTAVEGEAKEKSQALNIRDIVTERNNEGVAGSSPEDINGNVESDDGGIRATLEISCTGGVSYTRWGRTTCEGDADVLYTGYAAGKLRGSYTGSEIICLHSTPEWGMPNMSSVYKGSAAMSGVQYSFYVDDPFSKENLGGQPLANHDMPCAVCHLDTRTYQLMIPGRKSCPAGWTAEYWGYLVTSHNSNYGGNYQCLDQAPEGTPGGSATTSGTQSVYAAEINCSGAIPCPPYFNGYEVSCVVCTK